MSQKKIDLGYLLCLLVIFCVQSYLIFVRFIPATLETYSSIPEVQVHVRNVINVFSNLVSTWFFLAIIGPLARLTNIFLAERKAKRDQQTK